MEYLRGPRVERSVEMGRKAMKKATDLSITTSQHMYAFGEMNNTEG